MSRGRSHIFQIIALLLVFLTAILPTIVQAAHIRSISGKRLLVDLEGLKIYSQAYVYIINDEDKRVGIGQVLQVSGNTAIVELIKGRATVGLTVLDTFSGSKVTSDKKFLGGFLATFMTQNTLVQSVNYAGNNVSFTMKGGSDFNTSIFLEKIMDKELTLRGIYGTHVLKVSGTAPSGKSVGASFKLNTMEFLAKYIFFPGDLNLWVGGGLVSYSVASVPPGAEGLAPNSVVGLQMAVGGDYYLGKKVKAVYMWEYNYFSEQAPSIKVTQFRLGLGMQF